MTKKILVVDDERDFADSLGELVERQGYATERVYGGAEAIEKFNSGQYDLVLLDLLMPEVSGWDVLANIRNSADEKKKHTPVVTVSADTRDTTVFRAYKDGTDYHVAKPFRQEHLIDIVNYLIGDMSEEERDKLEAKL